MFTQSLKTIDKGVNSPAKRASSDKIEQLYQQFENLKTRITSSSRRKMDSSLERSTQLRSNKRNERPSDVTQRQSFLDKQEFNIFFDRDSTHENMRVSAHETAGGHKSTVLVGKAEQGERRDTVYLKYMMQKTFANFMEGQVGRFEREIQERMSKMDRRVKITHESLKQMHSVVILRKYKNSITDGAQNNSKTANLSSVREEENTECLRLKQHYEAKMAELTHHYEQKLRQLSFQCDKDKQTHSSSINPNSKHERELLSKENEINKLQLENSKWRRMIDQLKSKNQMQLTKIEQMSEEMGDMRIKMEKMQVRGQQGVVREKQLEKAKEEAEMLKQIMTLKDKDIVSLNSKIEDLQAQLLNATKPKHSEQVAKPNNSSIFQSLPIIPIISDPQEHQSSQFYTQLDEIEPDERSIKQFQLTKSQVIQPKRKKSMIDNMKKLEVEVNLISEENKHLKTKKDYFETQLKNTQLDEQRFQQQNALLKGQIRRLNTSIKIFDEVAYLFLKSATVDVPKVQELPEGIKSKPLFLEKASKRDKSKVK